MKPSPFVFHRPETLDEALEVLAEVGDDAKVLAGGQSLVPVLNMRLAAPGHLVDINRLSELAFVRVEAAANGARPGADDHASGVRVGAIARHAEVEHDSAASAALPLLRQALGNVAHPTIRNRGTTVGSLAHADPSGEMTAVLALLGGSVELRRKGAGRTVAAADFFVGPLESCIEAGEIATSAFFPVPAGRTGSSWVEVARRHGDYAMCGVGALVTVDDDMRVVAARTGYISVDVVPVVLDLTDPLAGRAVDAADWGAAGRLAAGQLSPEADIHASAEYRRRLVEVLTQRALAAAGRASMRDALTRQGNREEERS